MNNEVIEIQVACTDNITAKWAVIKLMVKTSVIDVLSRCDNGVYKPQVKTGEEMFAIRPVVDAVDIEMICPTGVVKWVAKPGEEMFALVRPIVEAIDIELGCPTGQIKWVVKTDGIVSIHAVDDQGMETVSIINLC